MTSATIQEQSTEKQPAPSTHAVLRFVATLTSYIFHPVFIPLFVGAFLLFVHPFSFTGFSMYNRQKIFFIILLNLTAFPLLAVSLLRALKFIDSFFLKTQKDRIIPYIACGIFFFWGYQVFKQSGNYPSILVIYVLGLFIASSAALIANIYFKVSMHAIGMGGWLGLFFLIFREQSMLMTWPLCAVLILTGWVCTSRMLLQAHRQLDIYLGLLIGIASVWIASVFVA
jgi:hypothetical protein